MATHMAIIIPPLQKGKRIEEWEPLFSAAVATLVTAEGGEKAAVRMLPIHVARREAERSIAAVALEKNTLYEAFKLFRDNLDPVIDEFEAVRRYYDMHWACGERDDDFFATLIKEAKSARHTTPQACINLVTQLSRELKTPLRRWITEKGE